MSSQDIDKAYISPYDKFFYQFDKDHQKSYSQSVEIKKHERIAKLRDNADAERTEGEIWQDF
ncbi:Uncharacterised protein [Legionella beliardensis]|uniref:Uncharacterized protein n=1 Tax=Legionella beliardensis TaxID=91822 RepID=A0A378I538_9GAMM|nr:CBU_0585 family protein [Legionella beliardensis]STX29816.1 Uncharacterised protein [Legionella beliardensis]